MPRESVFRVPSMKRDGGMSSPPCLLSTCMAPSLTHSFILLSRIYWKAFSCYPSTPAWSSSRPVHAPGYGRTRAWTSPCRNWRLRGRRRCSPDGGCTRLRIRWAPPDRSPSTSRTTLGPVWVGWDGVWSRLQSLSFCVCHTETKLATVCVTDCKVSSGHHAKVK